MCVFTGTFIETPIGNKVVDKIKKGDDIWGKSGGITTQTKVLSVKTKIVSELACIQFSKTLSVSTEQLIYINGDSYTANMLKNDSNIIVNGYVYELITDVGCYYASGQLLNCYK